MSKDIKSSVIYTALFDNDRYIGAGVSVTLPGVTLSTADIKGAGVMGTLAIPSTGQIESMEWVVNLRGIEADSDRLTRPGMHRQELRFYQDTYNPGSAKMSQNYVKIFLDGIFKSNDGGSVEQGNPVEGSATYELFRMQKFVDGAEILLIDKTKGIYQVNGTDYWAPIRSIMS